MGRTPGAVLASIGREGPPRETRRLHPLQRRRPGRRGRLRRRRGIRVLTHEELKHGDVSLAYVSKLMHRTYPDTPLFKRVLQTIWHQVNSGQEIFVVGKILEDSTVKGGTGWGAEFAKLCNKPLFVFDQERAGWFRWTGEGFDGVKDPLIGHPHFCGTGTRFLSESGAAAIDLLFQRSFR